MILDPQKTFFGPYVSFFYGGGGGGGFFCCFCFFQNWGLNSGPTA
jgi:hypothetical protein